MAKEHPAASSRKLKTTFNLDSPYTQVKWPLISADDQAIILEQLCSLLNPIGNHISHHIIPSKGKRQKKRKRKEGAIAEVLEQDGSGDSAPHVEAPVKPVMQKHLTVGFNSTTRYLELLSQASAPRKREDQMPVSHNVEEPGTDLCQSGNLKSIVAVFVPRSQPKVLYSHLPLLIKIASIAAPSLPPPRLVSLPEGAEERLSAALSIPRAGLIGLMDGALNSEALVDFIRQHVPEVEVPWLHEAAAGAYLLTNIKVIHTSAPADQKRSRPSKGFLKVEDD